MNPALPKEVKTRSRRPSAHAATVRDVAKAAGVSVATVSRVLNGKSTVAEALRLKVESVSLQMRYTPHAAARALATQRSVTIGAVIPTLEEVNFSIGVNALQQRLNTAGYTLLLANSNYDATEELRQVRALLSHGVAGMMLVGARHSDEVYQLLAAKGVPFVNTWVLDDEHPSVGFDNQAIGAALANYLLDLGHREFGVIAQQSPQSDRAAKRVAGIRAALQARGLKRPREQLISESHKIVDGQLAFAALMESPRRPTAVICGTDTLAFGAMVQAQAMGMSVPGDVSITGINDVEFAAHISPPLTTVRLMADVVGTRAAEYLLARIEGRAVANATNIPFTLVVRASTAAPGRRGLKKPGV
ncbi:MAG: LacI family DNA-binding transcriptional regulator [Bdellovibrionales bacterium]|nr:LacI family DNA-binding transcriptional regulator [Ramlibacter sp.]